MITNGIVGFVENILVSVRSVDMGSWDVENLPQSSQMESIQLLCH